MLLSMDVLYVGDHKLQTNQYFAGADSFQVFHREVADYEPLRESLDDHPAVNVTYMSGPETMVEFPGSVDELAEFDVLVISDLTRGTLEPHFYPDAIPGPNLLRIVKEFVVGGGGLLYCGGWMTFQGYQGVGNWHGTPVTDVLPVDLRPIFDDRVERPEGGEVVVHDVTHPTTAHLADESFPDVYGYNEVAGVTEGATTLATVDGRPLLAAGSFGDGRSIVYASDPGPKWGFGLMDWDGYDQFWVRVLAWLSDTDLEGAA
jgi:uncharacterized membrane protein